MNREFLFNILLLLGLNLLIKPFYIFGIEREIQNRVGAEEYGFYLTLFTFTFLIQVINDVGLPNFNNRAISQRPNRIHIYFPNILVAKILLAIIYTLVAFVLAWSRNYHNTLGYEQLWFLLLFFCLNHVLISLNLYLRSNITGLGFYRLDSLVSALDKTLLILICGVLLWGNLTDKPFQIEWFIYAQTLSLSLTTLIAFLLVYQRIKPIKWTIQLRFIKAILRQSAPYALVLFLMTIYTKIDVVMIEGLLPDDGKKEAGIYGAAYRLLDASNMIGFLFAGLLLPMFSKLISKKEELQSLVEMSWQMIWAGAITLAFATYFFQAEIMTLLYDEATDYYGIILGYLILSFIAVSGTYIFGTLLTANGSMRQMNQIFVVSIILNILLNYILIQEQKAAGAALATLFTQFFAFIAQVILAKKELAIRLPILLWGKILSFIITLILLGFALNNLQILDWRLIFIFYIGCGIGLSFLFRLIHLPTLFELLKSKKV